MNDDEMMIRWVKGNGHYQVADRLEALLAERVELVGRIEQLNREAKAVVNPSKGRVPVSWNECADWVEWFGPERLWCERLNRASCTAADVVRSRAVRGSSLDPSDFRLLPPPGLVAAPECMDGGGWLGQGKDVPDGWEWRGFTHWNWLTVSCSDSGVIVQCRPPVPKREPEWVPLTKLVGRTIDGCDKPVHGYETKQTVLTWWPIFGPRDQPFPDGTLDLDTGRVKVEPEGEQ